MNTNMKNQLKDKGYNIEYIFATLYNLKWAEYA